MRPLVKYWQVVVIGVAIAGAGAAVQSYLDREARENEQRGLQ